MTYMEHLQDNLRTYSPLEPLTDEEKEFLEETAQLMLKYPTIPCNDCKYCMPCPYGLDIPAVLLHYNRCVNEGNVARSGQDENYAKARRAFLVGYDRSVPKLRGILFLHLSMAPKENKCEDYPADAPYKSCRLIQSEYPGMNRQNGKPRKRHCFPDDVV